jgi:hypothetical protein
VCGVLAGVSGSALLAQSGDGTGPRVGETIPEFSAVDQHGDRRIFAELTGPNGLLLLFHRSADW